MKDSETLKELVELTSKCIKDFNFYAENFLKIRTKKGDVLPFVVNRAQKYILEMRRRQLEEKGYVRMMIVKGRQQGVSTLIGGLGYRSAAFNHGHRTFILAHEEEATSNLFEMTKRYHELMEPYMKPKTKASNKIELVFSELDSSFKLGTARNKSTGRSQTVQFLHASEAAFYAHADEHAKGVMQTVPLSTGTEVYMESTANGVGNWFHQMWQQAESGQSDYIAVFLPWFWQDEYVYNVPSDFILDDKEKHLKQTYLLSDAQIAWRRMKIRELSVSGFDGDKAFQQEYPCCPTEAFNSNVNDIFIQSDIVSEARKSQCEAVGPLLIGCDPARFGDDRTAIISRQGRVVSDLKTYVKYDTMQIAGILHNKIVAENPAKVFVDVGGLGAGVVDRLNELGHRDIVVAVNSAERALNDDRYANKRAEMWALGREWLLDKPVQLPDSDELHADLCGCRYSVDSKGRLKIESKLEQKKRGIRSSDTADAMLLTYALPVSYFDAPKKGDEDVAKLITRKSRVLRNAKNQGYFI